MSIREIVKILQEQGHVVSYYERKDGGLLIKQIDGARFTGSTGNLYARAMTGQTLSTKRAEQLWKITYGQGEERPKAYIEDRAVKKALERVQRKWRKAFGKDPSVGKKTAKKVKWSLEHRGREETLRLLSEAERYASGKAYTKNIKHLVDTINDYIEKAGALRYTQDEVDLLKDLVDSIKDSAWLITENSIQPAYQELYKLDKGVPVKDVVTNVKTILQIP